MFYKEKGFYMSILAGVIAIVAISAVCLNMLPSGKDTKLPNTMVADATNAPAKVTEAPVMKEESQEVAKVKPKATSTPKAKETTRTQNVQPTLKFNQEKGLLWPVTGKILMDYSKDQVVYFKTLQQYRTNPAILIASKEGTSVKSSADGIVKKVEKTDETGQTVTVSIGDNFSVVYGQLKNVSVKAGDSVKEGQTIGQIAKPSKYYSKEGTNLYYQVKQQKSTVNPLVLLR